MHNVFTVKSSSDWQLPQKSCLINFSVLKETYCKAPFRSFSIKYVCNGSERYIVNGNKYNIESGQYLLANHFSEGNVEIDETVKGICIDVAPDVLSEVVASYRRPDTPFADINLDTFFNTPNFFENKYAASKTNVGVLLQNLDAELSKDKTAPVNFTKEFYFTLAERILADHVLIYKQLQSIGSIKFGTKKDLLRRVMSGKEYIDYYFKTSLDIETIARISSLSEYHFFRVFKNAFGITPHQYIINKRLTYAENLLKKGNRSISLIAQEAGFSDIHSFSKSFKNKFGISPSLI